MSSFKHLVRETGRVVRSWPPAGARRGRRIAGLVRAALSARAVDLLEDAVEHSGGHARQWARLAQALEARDDPEGTDHARDIWQQIAEQFPHSKTAEQAHRHLGLLAQD